METLPLRRQTDCRQRSAFLSDCAPEPVGRRYSIPKVAVVPRCGALGRRCPLRPSIGRL